MVSRPPEHTHRNEVSQNTEFTLKKKNYVCVIVILNSHLQSFTIIFHFHHFKTIVRLSNGKKNK